MKWTSEQQKVIEYRDRNILVSAAAGSGKTAVLVERIIRRITDKQHPIDIDRLLVVTFTKAAAAEMRERIGNAVEKLLEESPEDENLKKQQTLIHNAQITTIDSFCLFVVRNHFEEIHLEPNFRIADPGEIRLLEMDVLNEVFEQEYERAKEAQADVDISKWQNADKLMSEADDFPKENNRGLSVFLQLVDAYSDKRSNKAVKEMVTKIYRQSASNPWQREWIEGLIQPYLAETKEELLNTELMQGIFHHVKILLMELLDKLEELKTIALQPDGPQKYADTLDKDLALLGKIADVHTLEDMERYFASIKFSNLAAIRAFEGDPLKKEAVSEGRKAIKEEVEALKKRYFSMSQEELVEQLQKIRPFAQELVRLALLYLEAMEAKKREKHLMDFSDIEHAALRILVDEKTKEVRPTALDFQKHLEEIMIDEYQDSNQVQEAIMCAISRGENMFMVGDVKQSIYRFRLARPELFMEKFATYHIEESQNQRIDLHKNFRSRAEVLDFTNDIFYKIMDRDLGKVAYDKEAALYCGAAYPKSTDMKAEVLLYELAGDMNSTNESSTAENMYYVQKKAQEKFMDAKNQKSVKEQWENMDSDIDTLSKRQLEARMIAERILELKKTLQVTDKGTGNLRPLKNSDIVILLRSLQGWGTEFVSVLGDCGIPAHVSTSTGYFSAMEVQTILSFLKILDNPNQDIPMAAVLKSAIVGLDNEELAEISLTEETSSFAEAALKQMESAEEGKLYYFKQLFEKLRKKVADTPIHLLIDMVLEDTGYGDYVQALPAGSQRKANLDMLVEKAIAYEKTSYKGLFHFVRYIDQLQKYEVDFGEADVIGENEDVVRIMTIHKSKGLEFPVVFVSGISKKFNENEMKDKIAIHPDMGMGLDEVQLSPRIKRKCLIRSEITDCIRRDNLGEELRVLYVAMTRAKEKLILTGVVKNQEEIYKKYKGMAIEGRPLTFGQRIKASKYLDWIAPAVLSYPFQYEFTFKNDTDMILAEAKKRAEQEISKEILLKQIENADTALVDAFLEKFSYEYPYKQEAGRKSKYSVSELKHDSMVEKYDRMEGLVEVPDFLLEEREAYVPEFARELFVKMSESHIEDEAISDNVDFDNIEVTDDNNLSKSFIEDESISGRKSELDGDSLEEVQQLQGDNFDTEKRQSEKSNVDIEKQQLYSAVLPSGINYGALRGTAVHRVMECMNFAAFSEVDQTSDRAMREFISNELQSMKDASLVPEEQLSLIRKQALFKFFKSPTALRMAKADARGELFREKAFVMDYNGVLVQGIIDVFWMEDDNIVLLDYKTDKVNTADELKARYETQLDLYAQALSRVFSTKERKIERCEKLIYSFCLHETIRSL